MSQQPRGIQDIIHFIEEGTGARLIRWFLVLVLLFGAGAIYQLTEARNFSSPEAMDAAQLGRNLAEGRGYTTSFIRPLSMHLRQELMRAKGADPRAVLAEPHPDLENAPVYPVLLAALLKALPVAQVYQLPEDIYYRRPAAEVAISALNLALFVLAVFLVFSLGQALFEPAVGWLAALLFAGTEMIWRFANSGLPTLLLMVLVLAALRALAALDRSSQPDAPAGTSRLLGLAAVAGGLLGLAALTRYSFLLLGLLVLVWLPFALGRKKFALWLTVAAVMFSLVTPWIARNWLKSGLPFGTATLAPLAATESFPRDRLERSQNPDIAGINRLEPTRKLLANLNTILQEELPRVGGNWVLGFFVVSLFVPFRDRTLSRIRWLVVAAVGLLLVTQASGRTMLTELSPVFNGENLLVVLAPVLFVFSAAMLQLTLDQIEWPAPVLRTLVTGAVVVFFSLPFLLSVLPPKTPAVIMPTYRPSIIRQLADYAPPRALLMSDVPWAVAWYGPRDCVWASLRVQDEVEANVKNQREDFYTLEEGRRPVDAVYISPLWANEPFMERFFNFADSDFAWGRYYLDVLLRGRVPTGFPLKYVLGGHYLQFGHFYLARDEWWGERYQRERAAGNPGR